jgi:hypothetical protein
MSFTPKRTLWHSFPGLTQGDFHLSTAIRLRHWLEVTVVGSQNMILVLKPEDGVELAWSRQRMHGLQQEYSDVWLDVAHQPETPSNTDNIPNPLRSH